MTKQNNAEQKVKSPLLIIGSGTVGLDAEYLISDNDNVRHATTENEWDEAVESAKTEVKLGRLRDYLRPILEQESKNIAQAAAQSISDFEAMKRGREMLRRIEEDEGCNLK